MEKPILVSCGVMLSKAVAMASMRAGWVRASALRREALTLLHIFNGIKLRGVGRQEEDLSPSLSDQGEGRLAFMRAEVVHDDDITLAQGWAQHAAQIGPKNLGIGRALGRWLRLASAGKAGILLFRLAGAARRFEAVVNLADLRLRDEISLHCDGFHMGLGGDTGWMIRRAS